MIRCSYNLSNDGFLSFDNIQMATPSKQFVIRYMKMSAGGGRMLRGLCRCLFNRQARASTLYTRTLPRGFNRLRLVSQSCGNIRLKSILSMFKFPIGLKTFEWAPKTLYSSGVLMKCVSMMLLRTGSWLIAFSLIESVWSSRRWCRRRYFLFISLYPSIFALTYCIFYFTFDVL